MIEFSCNSIFPHQSSSGSNVIVCFWMKMVCHFVHDKNTNVSSEDFLFTCRRFCISFSLYFPSLSSVQAFLGLSGTLGFVVTPLETVENFENTPLFVCVFLFSFKYPEVTPVINFDATWDEDHAAAGGGPDGQGDGQHYQQQLLDTDNRNQETWQIQAIQTSIMSTSCRNVTKSVLLFIM